MTLQQAETLIHQRRHSEALTLLKSILKSDPRNADVWWLVAQSLPDQPAKQQQAVERTLTFNPQHNGARAWLNGGSKKNGSKPRVDTPVVMDIQNIHKTMRMGEVEITALHDVSFQVQQGEFLGIIGPSGSGKSTLLGLMGGLDSPTTGAIYLDSVNIAAMNERQLTRLRNEKIGFVFQFFNLLPTLTALENVMLPMQFAHNKPRRPADRAAELLDMFGLGDRRHHRPPQLSGGQQQRVALARALANNPPLLLGDEPTGSLDTEATEGVLQALRTIRQTFQTTIVLVTHSPEVASTVDRLITLMDGAVVSDADPRASAQHAAVQLIKEHRY
jgi:putative ABC transport system ATP-binding protein